MNLSRSFRRSLLLAPLLALAFSSPTFAAGREAVSTFIVPDYKPYTFVNKAGEPDGFVVELAREACKAAGLRLKVSAAPWGEARDALVSGKIDFLPMMAYSAARDEVFDFTPPHTMGFDAVFSRRGGARAEKLADLSGLRVAALRGDAAWEHLLANGMVGRDRLFAKDSFAEALAAVDSGEVDAAVGPKLVGVEKIAELGFSLVVPASGMIGEYRRPYSFAVREGDLELLERLNQGLMLTKSSGVYNALYRKWFSGYEEGQFDYHHYMPWLFVACGAALAGLLALYLFNRRLGALVARKTAEAFATREELASERERAALFLELAPVMVVALDREGRVTFVNRRTCAVSGYADGELLGQSWFDLTLLPGERERVAKVFSNLIAGKRGKWEYVENSIAVKGGGSRLIAWRNIFICDASGAVVSVLSFGEDVTERSESLALLSASEARFRGLFENMTEAFALHEAVFDGQGRVRDYRWLEVNPAFERVTGLKADEITGKAMRETMPGEDPFWLDVYAKVVETGEAAHISHFSPELKKHFRVYAYRNAPGQFVTLFTDTTARRELEQQLQQAQKMEALGALAGGIAHDFNNILGAIIGYAELSAPLARSNPELAENIAEIAVAGMRARDLTRQILAFSRKSDEAPRPVDLALIAKEALKLLRSTVPSTIRMTIELPAPAAPCVLATPVQLHQVVMNLGTNAYHALRDIGGSVRFSIAAVELDAAEAERLAVAAGNFVRLTVADDGPGIAGEVLPRIFEPFYTTKAAGEGTGLGLAAVLSIARACGGAVSVDSAPGEGARFSVFFPAVAAEEERAANVLASAAPHSGSVLVVDDEATLAKLLARLLSRRGFTTEWRVSAEEALEAMLASPARWDAVVTDQTMPGLTGAQFLAEARSAGLMQPFVVCTGFSDVLNADDALRRGFSAYLKKPVRQEELVEAVADALEAKR